MNNEYISMSDEEFWSNAYFLIQLHFITSTLVSKTDNELPLVLCIELAMIYSASIVLHSCPALPCPFED